MKIFSPAFWKTNKHVQFYQNLIEVSIHYLKFCLRERETNSEPNMLSAWNKLSFSLAQLDKQQWDGAAW